MPEPPYGEIWDLMKVGKVVPFLGAGASLAGRAQNVKWDADQPGFLPNGTDLAHFLADKSSFPSVDPRDRDDLAKVASYFAEVSSRRRLRDRCVRSLPEITLAVRCTTSWQPRRHIKLLLLLTTILLSSRRLTRPISRMIW